MSIFALEIFISNILMDNLQLILPKLLLRKSLKSAEQKVLSTVVKQILKKADTQLSADEAFVMGYLNEQDQRYQKGIAYYDLAIKANPKFEVAYNNKGICLLELGEVNEGIEQFDKALAIDPTYFHAQLAKAKGLRRLEKAAESIAILEKIEADEEYEDEIFSELSSCYEQLGDAQKALENINKAIELSPNDANYIAQRALILLFLEKFEEALADFLVSQKTAGVNYVTQFNLGLCYAMIDGKDKDAHQMFTRSFNKFPGLLKDYFKTATTHESNRLKSQLTKIIERLSAIESSVQGKFYREELIDVLKRKLADA